MNTKLIIAREEDDSNTIRVTPKSLGLLMAQCTPSQLHDALYEMYKHQELYFDKEKRDTIIGVFEQHVINSTSGKMAKIVRLIPKYFKGNKA